MVVCFTIMHIIHRRAPICTAAVVMARQGFTFSRADVEDIAAVLQFRFSAEELRWDIKRQVWDTVGTLCRVAAGIDQLWSHAREVVKLEEWTVTGIHNTLAENMPALSVSSPYLRFHHCRALAVLAPKIRGRGAVARMGKQTGRFL